MTPIADMIERMAAENASLAAIIIAVRAYETVHAMSTGMSSGSQVESPDDALERRRKYDREYKRKRRLAAQLVSTDVSTDVSTGQSTGQVDAVLSTSLSSSCDSPKKKGIREEEEQRPELLEGQKKKVSRGTRMESTARLVEEDLQFALACGMSEQRAREAWAEFVDYWIGIPGQRGCKLNWAATWRNRVRELTGKGGKNERNYPRRADRPTGPDPRQNAVIAGVGRAFARRFANGSAEDRRGFSGGSDGSAGGAGSKWGAAQGAREPSSQLDLIAERNPAERSEMGRADSGNGDETVIGARR